MTPVMLLARIDGKSPVEYINSKKIKNTIRNKSFLLLDNKINSLNDIIRIINVITRISLLFAELKITIGHWCQV